MSNYKNKFEMENFKFQGEDNGDVMPLSDWFKQNNVTGVKFIYRPADHEKSCFCLFLAKDEEGNEDKYSFPMDSAFSDWPKSAVVALKHDYSNLSIIGNDEDGWVIIEDGGFASV